MVRAQSATDSLCFYASSKAQIKTVGLGIPQLLNSLINKSTQVGLTYNYKKGGLKQAQEAVSQKKIIFNAEGISEVDKFKLYGYFNFERSNEDSLAFSQKGIHDDFSPYYFVVGKPGQFEKQGYNGGGLISYNLVKDKLFIGTGVDYQYHTSHRSVDPRSSVYTYQLNFAPEISYKFNHHYIGLGILYGYGNERINVFYKNRDYQGTLLYPDRISYLNYGYGYLEINQNNFIRKTSLSGLQLNYAASFKSWEIAARLKYSIKETENKIEVQNSVQDQIFGSFQLENIDFNFLITQQNLLRLHQFGFSFINSYGDDNLRRLAARNFTYKFNALRAKYLYAPIVDGYKTYEFTANANYSSNYKRDAAANHTFDYSVLESSISVGKYWKNTFRAQLGLGLIFPLSTDLKVPNTQVNMFTKGVAYADYMYWGSTLGKAEIAVEYLPKNLIPGFKSTIKLSALFQNHLSSLNNNIVPTFALGKQRLDFNVGYNLYF